MPKILYRNDDPPDEYDGVTQLQEDILERLERAAIPESICDEIMLLIAKGEIERSARDAQLEAEQLAEELNDDERLRRAYEEGK
jgi:hypothetical protein